MLATAYTGTTRKYYCHCVMEDESELFLVMRAHSEAEASRRVHQGYQIQYVLDVLTPMQMEFRRKPLRRCLFPVNPLYRA